MGVTIKHANAEGNLISQLQLSFNVVLLLENRSEPKKNIQEETVRETGAIEASVVPLPLFTGLGGASCFCPN